MFRIGFHSRSFIRSWSIIRIRHPGSASASSPGLVSDPKPSPELRLISQQDHIRFDLPTCPASPAHVELARSTKVYHHSSKLHCVSDKHMMGFIIKKKHLKGSSHYAWSGDEWKAAKSSLKPLQKQVIRDNVPSGHGQHGKRTQYL